MRIVITGGTGLVGTHLVPALLADGHEVFVLVRKPKSPGASGEGDSKLTGLHYVPYGTGNTIPDDKLGHIDAVINLAGAPIAERWTEAYKQTIIKSRVETTMECVRFIQRRKAAGDAPSVFISASAVGYYGTKHTVPVTESAAPGNDFLSQTGRRWEAAATDAGIRTAIVRFGVILAADGGAFPKLLAPFKLYAGGYIGTGKQGFPWVHIEDVVGALRFVLDNNVQGPFNITAPQLHTNASFGHVVGKVMGRGSNIPVPEFVVRMMLGDAAILVTEGQQVIPERLLQAGYRFVYPDAEPAVRQLLAGEGK